MITSFILSKNRAAQLDVLLTSLAKNAQPLCSDIIVMWDATTAELREGYELLKTYAKALPFRICWWEQSSFFTGSFFGCLEWARQRGDFVLGLTDDTWFYRSVPFVACDVKNLFKDDTLCFSLRLGTNTIIQDIDRNTKMIPFPDYTNRIDVADSKILEWDWKKCSIDLNWGYPVSLDGTIYRCDDLIEMSKCIDFQNLREWEGNLVYHTKKVSNKNLMLSGFYSHCVNIPLNMVQPPDYKTIGPYGISVENLNKKFLDGHRFAYSCNENDVIGSHQYIKLV